MLYAGLDLSRKRLDFHLLDADGGMVEVGASPPDADGLRGLTESARRLALAPRRRVEVAPPAVGFSCFRFIADRAPRCRDGAEP
jgi:hypothetical protein